MKDELKLNFLGESIDREDFLVAIKDKLTPFIGIETYGWNIYSMMIIEMIKNIFDHAQNRGYAHFIKTDEAITFEVKSTVHIPFHYDHYRKVGLSSKPSKINYGIGLGVIDDLAKQLEINLNIDQSNGLTYKGSWVYNR